MNDVVHLLEAQIRDWQQRGFLSVPAAEELMADVRTRYGDRIAEPRAEQRLNVGIWILLSLGTVALAAAVGVWLAREWGEWSHALRVGLSLAVPTIFALLGLYFHQSAKRNFPALGRVCFTLAAVATLSVTTLLAAMYDLHPRHAVMTFIESGLFLVLAALIDSALLLWVGLIALAMAFSFEVSTSWGGWICLERPIPFVGFGLVVLGIGLLVRQTHRRLGGHVVIFGALESFLALFVIALEHSSFPRTGETTSQMWITLFVPYLIGLGVIAYRWAKHSAVFERAIFVPFLSLLVLMALASLWPERWYQRSWVDTTLFTLATLAGAYLGVVARSAALINVSVVFFALDVFDRFIEWFWDVMPGFVFFGLMGALLIIGGISLERVRRALVRCTVTP